MTLDLMKITAALNAYPWIAGTLTARGSQGAAYCAVGLLLRYAGVTHEEIARAAADPWTRYEDLLRADYGIEDRETLAAIMFANDTADSHEEAIARVQRLLDGSTAREALFRRLGIAVEGAGSYEPPSAMNDDGPGSLAALV